jgi:DNA-binding transcriptional regulator YdaS (Cro superfamily)
MQIFRKYAQTVGGMRAAAKALGISCMGLYRYANGERRPPHAVAAKLLETLTALEPKRPWSEDFAAAFGHPSAPQCVPESHPADADAGIEPSEQDVRPASTPISLRRLASNELRQWTEGLQEADRARFVDGIEACLDVLLNSQGSNVSTLQSEAIERLLWLMGELRALRFAERPMRRARRDPAMTIDELSQHIARIGSQSALARAVGASQGYVNQWVNGRAPITAKYVEAIRSAPPEPRHAHMTFAMRQAMYQRLVRQFIASAGGLASAAKLLALDNRTLLQYLTGEVPLPRDLELAMRDRATPREFLTNDVP